MAWPQEPLFSSNDPQGRLFEETGQSEPKDPDVAQRERYEAATKLGSNAEKTGNIDVLALTEAEVRAQKRLTREKQKELAFIRDKERAVRAAAKAVVAAERGQMAELRSLAKKAGRWDPEKDFMIIGNDGVPVFLSEKQMKEGLARGEDKVKAQVKVLESQIAANAIGTIPSSSNMKSNSKGFRFTELLDALASGNIGTAFGELLQPFGGDTGKGERMIERGQVKAERASTIKGRLAGRGMMLAGRFMGPAGIIAAQQIAKRAIDFTQDRRKEGQVTGEGFGAGMASLRETFNLAKNPFDMLDRRTAAEIVAGVRSKGFKGEIGRAMQDSIGSVFKDLGTDWQGSLDMLNQAVRENIMSVEEFTDMMTNLDDVAKETGFSVQTIQNTLKGVIDLASAKGGRGAAEEAARIFPGMVGMMEGTNMTEQQMATFLQGNLPNLAARFGGVPTMFGSTEAVQKDSAKYMDMLVNDLQVMYKADNWPSIDMFAAYLMNSGYAQMYLQGFESTSQLADWIESVFADKAKGITFQSSAIKERKRRIEDIKAPSSSLRRGPGGGPVTDTDPMQKQKEILQKINDDLRSAGLSEEQINAILGNVRKPVFSPGEMTRIEREKEFNRRLEETKEKAQTEIQLRVDVTPEASRWFDIQNTSRNDYTYRGKGSQGTRPLPAVR